MVIILFIVIPPSVEAIEACSNHPHTTIFFLSSGQACLTFSTSLLGLTFKPLGHTPFNLDPYQETFSNNWVLSAWKTAGEYQKRAILIWIIILVPLLVCIAVIPEKSIACINQTYGRIYHLK
jgi:hypothetical protein